MIQRLRQQQQRFNRLLSLEWKERKIEKMKSSANI